MCHNHLITTPTNHHHTHKSSPHPLIITTPTHHHHTHSSSPHPLIITTPTHHHHTHSSSPHPLTITTPTHHHHTHSLSPHPLKVTVCSLSCIKRALTFRDFFPAVYCVTNIHLAAVLIPGSKGQGGLKRFPPKS